MKMKLNIDKTKCKGQHFFEMLNLISDFSVPSDNSQRAYVICRKCGEIRVVGIINLTKNET
ncbi:MAG: hypothetical protein BWY19_01174 [bacterium ADurb.Bin212]|nr:MAG: hypothetical protein BWY19_01174 [bacterium ADurb.Bin212]